MATLTFLGAAGSVTGSRHLVEAGGKKLLLDCGLFQGGKELRLRNWAPLPVEPESINWVVLSHAHIDHTGYLPRMVHEGFRGTIYANAATRDLCAILLPDAAHIQEEDAEHAAFKGYSKHEHPQPLYTVEEAQAALGRIQVIPSNAPFRISSQFSVRLMDFINNMTHEFKTPISTVSVAAETMMHPNVIHDEEKLRRYGTVIQDENLRMKHQVDKILQMAVLEEGTYKLKCGPVDVHEIISKAAENTALQVEARAGTISCALEADSTTISADVVHFTNIINNLLDNAVKYSHERPEIKVSTRNSDGSIRITIADNGIGISEEDQRRVFEKYFRVHTGNVHNVKGFGLGLSYVKLMTEAQGGSITLNSTPGRGTSIELSFPVIATP